MQSITPPPLPFLQHPGDPPLEWKMWLRSFNAYLGAIDAQKFRPERKKNILYYHLGIEGQNVFDHLPEYNPTEEENLDEYQIAVAQLSSYFSKTKNLVVHRYKFFTRSQKPEESIDTFITSLKMLAATCEFENFTSQLIRDQLIARCSCRKIQERLLTCKDPPLDKAIDIAKSIESSGKDLQQLEVALAGTSISTATSKEVFKSNNQSNVRRKSFPQTQGQYHKVVCFRCGSFSHISSFKKCPALGQQCRQCGKIGHFFNVCRSGKKKSINLVTNEDTSGGEDDHFFLNEPILTCKMIQCVSVVNEELILDPEVQVLIEGVEISLLVDTGARITIISKDKYENLSSSKHLLPPDVLTVAFEGSRIELLGYFWTTLQVLGKSIKGKVYVAFKGINILGLIHQAELDIIIRPGSKTPVSLAQDNKVISQVLKTSDRILWLEKYKEVFEDKLGKITDFVYTIKMKDDVIPFKHKMRNVPHSVRKELSDMLANLSDQGIIEKVEATLWLSPIVLARKGNGELRMCIDLRRVNEAIWVDSFPLPRIDDLITKVGQAKWYSKLDLRSAYHQIVLDKDSRHITAFVTPDGVFQFCRLPFGLASAAAIFQRVMSEMLKDYSQVVVFQDDILLFTDDEATHDKLLECVFSTLKGRGVTLRLDKCVFKVKEIEYLGHILSEEGVKPKPALVKSIVEAPAPVNKEQLMSFLGLCEFYAKFMKNFTRLTECLRSLLKKGVCFNWSKQCQENFIQLKQEIVQAQALTPFVEGRTTIVMVDACEYGLGAVLTQQECGREFTLGFASRTLREVERKYSTIEKELLACVWGIEKFKPYLWGRKFVLKTDHKPLVEILSGRKIKNATARISRLTVKLLEYNFTVVYIPGRQNSRADCLSRLPIPPLEGEESETAVDECFIAAVEDTVICASKGDWLSELRKDADLNKVMNLIAEKWPKESSLDYTLQMYWKVKDELSIEDGLLVRGDRLIPPLCIRSKILTLAHQGHPGKTITKRKVKQNFWWPRMDHEIEEFVGLCTNCNNSDKTLKLEKEEMPMVNEPKGPWQKIAIDFLGPYQILSTKMQYFIVVLDHFSRWVEVKAVCNSSTYEVINFLQDLFLREGVPKEILTDNGVQFLSQDMQDFLKSNNILHIRTPLYSPKSNGRVERFNKILVECIQLAVQNRENVPDAIKKLIWSHRTTPHVATNITPFEGMRGRKAISKLYPFWLSKWHEKKVLPEKEDLTLTYQQQKFRPNNRVLVGDWVRVKNPVLVRKGLSKFKDPLQVIARRPNAVRLSDGSWWNLGRVARDPSKPRFKGVQNLGQHDEGRLRVSNRKSAKPKKLQDYIIYK